MSFRYSRLCEKASDAVDAVRSAIPACWVEAQREAQGFQISKIQIDTTTSKQNKIIPFLKSETLNLSWSRLSHGVQVPNRLFICRGFS
jgi:hypothetical protein